MAQDARSQDLMNYDALAQDALRGVVKAALQRAASPEGIPGEHHFYITFKSKAPGISGPPDLLSQYPDEMTIVLQHQYWELAPGETFFTLTLKFGGRSRRLSIPYAAVTRFYDPSVQFLLQFEAAETPANQTDQEPNPAQDAGDLATAGGDDAPKVISLDQFRKK